LNQSLSNEYYLFVTNIIVCDDDVVVFSITMRRRALLLVGVILVACLSAISLYKGASLVILDDATKSQSLDEPTTQLPAHNTTIELGRVYSARACQLNPGWGTIGVKGETNVCVGKKPVMANTTAGHLTCSNEKPTTTDRSYQGITVALLYFAKPALLFRQLQEFGTYPMEIQKNLTILVIDDGSPPGLRVSDYLNISTYSAGFRIRLARIETERNWNIGGARNLAFYLVDTPKTLLLDLDILAPREAMEAAVSWPLIDHEQGGRRQLAHRFNRRNPGGKDRKHPAVCVIRTDAYWENGGCDEDFCGNYGYTDVHFWFKWKADPTRAMVDHLDVFLEELDMMACDPAFLGEKEPLCKEARSKQVKPDRALKKNHALYKEKTNKGCWSNKYLRFRWVLEY
jgi:hypothetical protein